MEKFSVVNADDTKEMFHSVYLKSVQVSWWNGAFAEKQTSI